MPRGIYPRKRKLAYVDVDGATVARMPKAPMPKGPVTAVIPLGQGDTSRGAVLWNDASLTLRDGSTHMHLSADECAELLAGLLATQH